MTKVGEGVLAPPPFGRLIPYSNIGYGALNHVKFRAAMHPPWCMIYGAAYHVRCTAATNPTWFVAEREGFEPSIPLLAEYTISNRAPSASRESLRLTIIFYLSIADYRLRRERGMCSLVAPPFGRRTISSRLPREEDSHPTFYCSAQNVHGGGSRIRTHVPFRRSGFQDRRLKPLGHPSAILTVWMLCYRLSLCTNPFRLRRRE